MSAFRLPALLLLWLLPVPGVDTVTATEGWTAMVVTVVTASEATLIRTTAFQDHFPAAVASIIRTAPDTVTLMTTADTDFIREQS
jgi:hypothetical protein